MVAFFIMAFAASLPNFFIGIMSALNGIPELSFGDVVGSNVVDLTLVIALAVLFAKNDLSSAGHIIQTSSFFTMGAAILPLLLFVDGNLSRIDGLILLAFFFVYVFWLFSKKERFKKIYNHYKISKKEKFRNYLIDIVKVVFGSLVLMAVSQGIIFSAQRFSSDFGVSLPLVGILAIGLGTSFPELYFSIISARKGETRMILGDLLGSIVIPSTLVLGTVVLISPITIADPKMFALARLFLAISAVFFFIFVRTGQKLTKKEASLLLLIYIVFLVAEVFAK